MNPPDITYEIIESVHRCGDASRVSYGISAYVHDKQDNFPHMLLAVYDISGDRAGVLALVEQCNRFKLSPHHLTDVIDDFLG